eukprot:SAG22_NODE_162_length_16848_cov_16.978267_11_plen_578_part_00
MRLQRVLVLVLCACGCGLGVAVAAAGGDASGGAGTTPPQDTFSLSVGDGGRTLADLRGPGWKRTVSACEGSKNTTLVYKDATTVVALQRFFGGGGTETLLRLSLPASAQGPSPLLTNISSLDTIVPVPAGETATLHGFAGGDPSPAQFASTLATITRAPLVFEPKGGRSSNGVLGFFAVQTNSSGRSEGLVLSIGWSGSWRATFERVETGVRVRVALATFSSQLHPGESFRAVRVLAVNFSGAEDVYDGYNAHRRILAKHYLRKDSGGNIRGGIVSSWTAQFYHAAVNTQNMIAMTSGVKAAGVENTWIDFGWYKSATCADTGQGCSPPASLGDVGNWKLPPTESVNANAFPLPLSLKAVANVAHAGDARTKFTVWFEPESVCPDCYLGPSNASAAFAKGWAIDDPLGPRLLLDLGNAAARTYMTKYLSSSIQQFGLDVLRMDFNQDPAPVWAFKDEQVAKLSGRAVQHGMSEVKHVEGLYRMWSDVLADNPNVLLDNCASGGRRIDLETSTLSTPLWQSDLAGNKGDVSESWQSMNLGLSTFLPIHSGGCPRPDGMTTSGPTGEKGLTTEVEPYVW